VLLYTPSSDTQIKVGELEFDGEAWTFKYSDEYKQRRAELRPIEGLDDVDLVYRSTRLFPFFAVRIPDAHRTDVKRELERAHVKDPNPVDLLRLFGRHVVSSPAFELVPAA
jgi:HipA-like protein